MSKRRMHVPMASITLDMFLLLSWSMLNIHGVNGQQAFDITVSRSDIITDVNAAELLTCNYEVPESSASVEVLWFKISETSGEAKFLWKAESSDERNGGSVDINPANVGGSSAAKKYLYSGHSLTLRSLQQSDSGRYHCQVKINPTQGDEIVADSPYINLNVYNPPNPALYSYNGSMMGESKMKAGSLSVLECRCIPTLPDDPQDVSYKIKTNEKEFECTKLPHMVHGEPPVCQHNITFKREDNRAELLFWCVAMWKRRTYESAKRKLRVEFGATSITITSGFPPEGIDKGESHAIVCETDSANPKVGIVWRRAGVPISEDNKAFTTLASIKDGEFDALHTVSRLYVTATADNVGKLFDCMVKEQPQIIADRPVAFGFKGEDPPTATISGYSNGVVVGEEMNLECTTDQPDKNPVFSWTFMSVTSDGDGIPETKAHLIDGPKVVKEKVTMEDQGVYTCTVKIDNFLSGIHSILVKVFLTKPPPADDTENIPGGTAPATSAFGWKAAAGLIGGLLVLLIIGLFVADFLTRKHKKKKEAEEQKKRATEWDKEKDVENQDGKEVAVTENTPMLDQPQDDNKLSKTNLRTEAQQDKNNLEQKSGSMLERSSISKLKSQAQVLGGKISNSSRNLLDKRRHRRRAGEDSAGDSDASMGKKDDNLDKREVPVDKRKERKDLLHPAGEDGALPRTGSARMRSPTGSNRSMQRSPGRASPTPSRREAPSKTPDTIDPTATSDAPTPHRRSPKPKDEPRDPSAAAAAPGELTEPSKPTPRRRSPTPKADPSDPSATATVAAGELPVPSQQKAPRKRSHTRTPITGEADKKGSDTPAAAALTPGPAGAERRPKSPGAERTPHGSPRKEPGAPHAGQNHRPRPPKPPKNP